MEIKINMLFGSRGWGFTNKYMGSLGKYKKSKGNIRNNIREI